MKIILYIAAILFVFLNYMLITDARYFNVIYLRNKYSIDSTNTNQELETAIRKADLIWFNNTKELSLVRM